MGTPIATTAVVATTLLAVSAGLLVNVPTRTHADEPVDISGDWKVTLVLEVSGSTFYSECLAWVVQKGASLDVAISCQGTGSGGRMTGTIDKTGAFALSGPIGGVHHDFSGTYGNDGSDYLNGTWSVVAGGRLGARRWRPDQWGDFDCSYEATSVDVLAVLQHSATGDGPSYNCAAYADVDVDGRINSVDALLILQLEAGLVVRLPIL